VEGGKGVTVKETRSKRTLLKSVVRGYIRSGYAPVPIPAGKKAPTIRGWQKLRLREDKIAEYFGDSDNVGLLLGKPSGGLVDVDLDAPEALVTAPAFLPATQMLHGRRSKPNSHWWYRVESAPAPQKFTDLDGSSLVELRSNGQQTIVPPSCHPSGERLRWEKEGEPANVELDELLRSLGRVAASTILARHWPEPGTRNEAALALSGTLLRPGWSLTDVEQFLKVTARAAGDEQWKERVAAANSTQARLAGNEEATGATRLRELVGDGVVTRVQQWLEIPEETFTASDGENLTDLGNSRRLVRQHGDRIRYCYVSKCWYRYTGKRWKPDLNGAVERLAKKTVQALSQLADQVDNGNLRKALAKWARTSESRSRITAMIDLARSEPGIPVDPAALDSDPWLLNFKNGTLDLRNGQLRDHNAADLCTKMVPYDFDPEEKCPVFKKFLERIFNNNVALQQFVQRAFGYALTGSTREQVFFVFWGSGANGKSTLLEAIRRGLGDYAIAADASLLMAKTNDGIRNDVARLAGSRLVSTGETESGRFLAEALVKQLTGGDKITARFLYQEFFEYDSQFKLFLATNHKPIIRGVDNAIWRRIRLVPFQVTIPPEEQDKSLPQKLRREMPGILAWLVRGCLKWRESGLDQPDEVLSATQAYRVEMDVIGGFLKDKCVERSDLRESAATLYSSYKSWCEANGERALTQQRFGIALSDRGFARTRTRRARFWIGLKCGDVGDTGDAVLQ
jgi:putative DNA primase/helicase